MLLKTYDRILELFHGNHGYMNFEQLKDEGITVTQIQELTEKGVLDKFARGWYWCGMCGIDRPEHHRYIEIGMANKNAVICMDSACYLQGLLKEEPDVISVATERTDRKKMEFAFPVRRYYLQNTGLQDEIEEFATEFGSFKVYSADRSACDCIRMKDRLGESILEEIRLNYRKKQCDAQRLLEYGKRLRALKCVKEQAGQWYDIDE